MSSQPVSVIDHSTLTLGRRLGQGGQGTVYEVPQRVINRADGGGWPVVYKEYSAAVLPELDAAALEASVALVGELSATDARWLCEKTAWPAAVVKRHHQTCGFLMRAVPERFRFTLRGLGGAATGTERLANLEYLLNDDSYVAGIGLTVSERDRLAVLKDLAGTLTRLHRIGITVGDLSPKNLLFATAPQAECFLIDCDAMRLRGATVLPQAETPDWQVPDGEEKATRASDVYKFGLLAVRLFARDQTATDPAALAAVHPELGDLARAGIDPDPSRRPALSRWAEQLAAVRSTASAVPAAAPRPGRQPNPSGSGPGAGNAPSGPTVRPGPGAHVPGTAVAGIAAAIAVLVFGLSHVDDSSPGDSEARPQSDVSAPQWTPDEDAPTLDQSEPDESEPEYTTPDPEPSYDPPDPDPTYDPPDLEPTYDPPDPEPTYDPPEPEPTYYYGAIAVSSDGSIGRSWDYSSRSAAEEGARDGCPRTDCKVLTTFVNGCGAVAHNPNTGQYWGGHGATRNEAVNNAISNAGGGRWITSVCTRR
ncbi:DUF4189 domain-containing protein [Streptomyces sp. XD-27]|uniref:DUF4189 domain-containing protein n=1 Tax=Streptomyces sp. XD-27 TaxID=3062779 RepID=UPI0026F464DA|nr:DUF4189 domain-containing protein [Streptomyces sp. XD-27]WKX69535.1 DUF4189 domain-containing protein [Streptomyces sp. XD-27]